MPRFLALVDAVDGRQTVSIEAGTLEQARAYAELDYGKDNVRAVWPAPNPSVARVTSPVGESKEVIKKHIEDLRRQRMATAPKTYYAITLSAVIVFILVFFGYDLVRSVLNRK